MTDIVGVGSGHLNFCTVVIKKYSNYILWACRSDEITFGFSLCLCSLKDAVDDR